MTTALLRTTTLLALLALHLQATAADDTILGQGALKYKVVPGWGDVSVDQIQLQNCHAMRQDASGRIVMINTGPKNNVIIYSPEGKVVATWGTTYPGAHGLAIIKDADGECLWLTDHDRHDLIKTMLDGKELRVIPWPEGVPPYTKAEEYKPTDIEFGDDGSFYVCDGYGLAMVLHYTADGKLIRAFGGKGNEAAQLNTPYGCAIDRRDPTKPLLVVAFRGYKALKRFTLAGDYVDTIPMPGADVCDVLVHGKLLYIPNLNGYVSILDQNNRVVSNVGGSAPVYDSKGALQLMQREGDTFIHLHNLYVDAAGSIYVAQWNSKGT
ncbi:MAG TPA: 6-bladed beta-propeller, partial [Planctomycetota bacterium]|nr:6-bladed beta-propeller [Planctomycetota bacterium]